MFHPEAIPAVVVNLATDEIEDLQTKGWNKGRIPKIKRPLLEWGPFHFRSDGKTRIRRERKEGKRRSRRRDGLSSSLSLKLSTDILYGELRFRF